MAAGDPGRGRSANNGDAIDCAAALSNPERFDAIIDVRSPAEYADDHLPGAINCPVLTDAQRAEVGTLHAQASSFEAKRRGAALVARNIAFHLESTFAAQPRQWAPLVYCWRGGQRSAAMTHVLAKIGWRALQLEGGYRAFRRTVVGELDGMPPQLRFCVICGTTGTGKSRLLRHLRRQGAQVLDLEDCANHRGSVLGGLPSLPQPSQKRFETMLWWALRAFDPARPVFVESESRKVGRLNVPSRLIEAMRSAPCLRLELPVAARVRLLREEYPHFERDHALLFRQLDCLAPLHGKAQVEQWKRLAAAQQWDRMVERLLIEHYDPAYRRSIARNFARVDEGRLLALADGEEQTFAAAAVALAQTV